MNHRLKRSLQRWLPLLLTQLTLISCTTGQPIYFHSFSFNTGADAKIYGHPEIDVLDYEYGSSHQFSTRPSKEDWQILAMNGRDSFGAWSTTGAMPRGEYLYVKWRIKATGEILEDRVDLTKRLPADMTNYGLHFAIYGSQLYVYLFPPVKFYDVLNNVRITIGHPPGREHGKALLDIPYAQQHQIYPDIQK